MNPPTLLMLVRHGETPANLEGVWHGSIDSPLTERGRVQVDRVARFLGESFADSGAVYSSHLQRARDTAHPIAVGLGLEMQVDEDLGEYNLGSWEGKTYRELFEDHNLWHHMKHDPDFAPHGGETPRQVAERITGALRRIAARHAGQRIIVVAHGGALTMAFGALLDGDYTEWRGVMDNCAVSELRIGDTAELLRFNLTDHLTGV